MIIIENRIGSGSSYIHAKHARSKSARAAIGFRLPPALRIRALPFKQWVWGSNPQRVTKNPECTGIRDFTYSLFIFHYYFTGAFGIFGK